MDKGKRERLPVSVSVAVYITDTQGKLLLLKQEAKWKGGKWGPPAGGMDAHENPITTAIRETKEEIDVDVRLTDLIGVYTVDRGDSATGIAFVFRGDVITAEIKVGEGEISDFKFYSPNEVKELVQKDLIYKPEYNLPSIKDWLNGHSYSLESIKALGK